MSFGLTTSLSALIPDPVGALINFAVATSVKSVRLTNTSGSAVTVAIYFDYDGTSTNPIDMVLAPTLLGANESVLLDGGPWHFGVGGRISGIATTTNVVNIHVTPASI